MEQWPTPVKRGINRKCFAKTTIPLYHMQTEEEIGLLMVIFPFPCDLRPVIRIWFCIFRFLRYTPDRELVMST